MPERVLVRFEGDGPGAGELTWGQLAIWGVMQDQRSSLHLSGVHPLRAGTSVDDVAAGVRYLMSRHPSLRTRLSFGADGMRQVLAASGEVAVDIVDAGDADPAGTAGAVARRFESTNFDYACEWPLRLAVVRQRGVLTHRVLSLCHLAADGSGAMALVEDLAVRDRAAQPPVPGMQPLEQARWQRSPAGRRHSDAALRYWERLLRSIPARGPGGSGGMCQPRFQEGVYRSPAMYLAARAVAVRTRFSISAVLLAALAAALGEVTGNNPVVLQLVVSNRFRRRLAATVSPVAQPWLCVIDAAGITFDEAVTRAWRSATAAAKHAYYDPVRQQELLGRVGRERGGETDIAYTYNDRRVVTRQAADDTAGPPPAGQELRAALPRSTLRWDPKPDLRNPHLSINALDVPGAVEIAILTDTRRVPLADVEACLRIMEAVLVRAALDPAA